jgi:hypothetical protein
MPFCRRRVSRCLAVGTLTILGGCEKAERDLHQKSAGEPAEPPDSLASAVRTGQEIWFTLSRNAQSPDGRPCVERGLEIRTDGKRIPIPLLYTREAPVLLNDSTLRAKLYTNCGAIASYRVDLRCGRPVRERSGVKP